MLSNFKAQFTLTLGSFGPYIGIKALPLNLAVNGSNNDSRMECGTQVQGGKTFLFGKSTCMLAYPEALSSDIWIVPGIYFDTPLSVEQINASGMLLLILGFLKQ